jgi:iron(III) transport system ATP-binding protein
MMALTVSRVRKSYSGTQVLRGVSLSVRPGTLTAILGASGAGKTTLLRVIAGFEPADGGSVTLGDVVVDDGRRRVPPERRHIGYVPQDGALFPHLTVRGNAAFALPRRSRRGPFADEILALVGLADLGSRYPHELSGGQQQRVAIARALASRPRLVLLDEPFAALDASLRATVRADVLAALRAVGTTAVLVTHDQDEALSAADYVAVLRDGVITQSGPPRSVYSVPADPWTAAFLGTANLLPGVPASGPGGSRGVRTALGWHVLRDAEHESRDAEHESRVAEHESRAAGQVSDKGGVTVLIRPEQITLSRPSSAVSGVPGSPEASPGAPLGAVTGKVAETRYHGHDALIAVDVAEAGLLQVRELGTEPPQPGDEVSLTVSGPVTAWPAERGDREAAEPVGQPAAPAEPGDPEAAEAASPG